MSASVASGMGAPTFVLLALFSATSRVSDASANTGSLLLGVCEPSTLWPDCVPRPVQTSGTSVLVPSNSISSSESSRTGPSGLLRFVPSLRKMPLSSESLDTTV